ncbi:hypothetical protein STRIP9103_00107, partial [Streptomyces ipomoeae 91-03]
LEGPAAGRGGTVPHCLKGVGAPAGRGRSAPGRSRFLWCPGHSAQSNASAVMGSSRTLRPVAWKTALAMAGATPIITSSPRPLTPIGSAS